MRKRTLLTVIFSLAFLLLLVPEAFNNASQPPVGHTNAPSEGNCSTAGCHVSTPVTNRNIFRMDILSRPATYDTSVTYNLFVNNSAGTPMYGFEVTAIDGNGYPAGNFTITNANTTSLAVGSNSRQYVGHKNANSTNAWAFRWKPNRYVGPVTFYVAGLGANNDGTVTGDQTYLDTLVFSGQGQPANVDANFNINNTTVCIGDAVTFTNTSTGTLTTYNWNFGAGATPATANTVGPHNVTYSTAGAKTITLTVGDGVITDTETKTVTVVTAPVANAGPDKTICIGTSTTLTASGGTTYTWSNGAGNAATVTVSPLSTTTYTVTATSGSCSATDNVVVFVNPRPNADAGPNDTACLGQPSVLTATGGVSYLWNTSQTTATISAVLPTVGSFTAIVTVTDANGCTAVDSAKAVVLALPTVTVADVTTCGTGTATLDAGPGFSSYLWSNAVNTRTNTVTTSGTYTVTVTDANGCNNSDAAQANILSNLAVSVADATLCPGGTVTLSANYPGATYLWSNNATTETITVSSAGTYTVTVTDGSCSGSDAGTVTLAILPPVGAGNDITICAGDVASIGNPDSVNLALGTYAWLPTTGVTDPTNPVTTARPLTTTTYILSATANSCTKRDTVVVTVNQAPLVTLGGLAANYCASVNTSQTMVGSPAGGVYSGPGVSGNSFNPATAGVGTHNIVYTYFDAGLNCTGRDTITVTVNPVPVVVIQSIQAFYCIDEPAFALQATPSGGTFSGPGVSGGQFNPSVAGAGTNTITYTYTSAAGCSNSATVTYTVVSFQPAFSGLGSNYCSSDNNAVALTGSPTGGTFSGPGITGSSFTPSLAGAGTHNIAYTNDSLLGYTVNNALPFVPLALSNATTYTFANADEDLSNALPLGFNFNFFGVDYSQVKVSTNGFLTFDATLVAPTSTNQTLPSAASPNNLVAFMWDDLEVATFDYALTGTAPNRQFVINIAANHFGSAQVVQAQVVLHETTNTIDIHCINCEADNATPSATQGIEDATGNRAFVASGRNNTAWSATGSSVSFIPTSCAFTSTQQVTVGGVIVNVADTSICAGQSVTITASGATTYSWAHGPNTPVITVSPSDTTVYTVTGVNGACTSTATATVNISPAVVAGLAGVPSSVCSGDLPITLFGSPAGGVFAGPGVSGNTFDPSQAVLNATNTITYTVSNQFGCSDTANLQVFVTPSPNAQFTLAATEYCLSALPVTLNAIPAGGIFSGPGISNSTFVPYFAGVGVHQLVYRVPVAGGCDAIDTITVTVYDLPNVTFSPIAPQYCAQSDSVQLVAAPIGGTFAGPGVNADYFNPATAGAGGPYIISYTYVDSNGCSNNSVQLTEVVDNPILQWVGLVNQYCKNGADVSLAALPAGGSFTGTGVSGNIFSPNTAGAGAHTLNYTYTDNAGCDGTLGATVVVNDVLQASIDNLDSTYCVNAPLVILSGFPSGGVFSGNGVIGGVFSPDSAGTGGPYTITYTYTDTNGCVSTANGNTRIKPAANLLLDGLDPNYCSEDDIDLPVNVAPTGGVLLGSGISGSNFNPSNAGFGNYVITYEYTNSEGCTSYASYTVAVQPCTSIDEVENAINIGLYPNPTTGILNFVVTGLDGQDADATVFSIQGQRVMQQQYLQVSSHQPLQLDMGTLAPGSYLVQLKSNNYSSVHRVIISR